MEPGDIVTYGFYGKTGIIIKIIGSHVIMIAFTNNDDYKLFKRKHVGKIINYK